MFLITTAELNLQSRGNTYACSQGIDRYMNDDFGTFCLVITYSNSLLYTEAKSSKWRSQESCGSAPGTTSLHLLWSIHAL